MSKCKAPAMGWIAEDAIISLRGSDAGGKIQS